MAKPASEQAREKAKEIADNNGVANPSGAPIALFSLLYVALIPATSYLTAPTTPVIPTLIALPLRLLPGLPRPLPVQNAIPAYSALYTLWTFGATGAFSAAGQAMAREEGLDNFSPRQHVHNLRGLPLKLRSAHYNLMENFGGFALAASLAVAMGKGGDQHVVNLLGLHVLLKGVVYYASYLTDVAPVRTLSHVLATSAVVDVLWRLARGAA